MQSGQPAVWSFCKRAVRREHVHAQQRLAQFAHQRHSGRWGVWGQGGWVLTTPFLRVSGGDTLRVTGYMRAPGINGGGQVGITRLYERHLPRDSTRDVSICATTSSAMSLDGCAHSAIWCGEFGRMSAAPDSSQENWYATRLRFDERSWTGWAMWSYRAPQPPYHVVVL
ncbi:MAG: hypothetical protein IPK53_12500 [bacterium]|nr:hypothetical protein [bacterium]